MSPIRIGSLVAMLILFYTPALAKDPSGSPLEKTICHKYDTPAQKTLTLPQPAAVKHMVHGDTYGECPSSSSIACPCFTDLSQLGFTDQAICNNSEGNADIFDVSSSFLFAQASVSTCGLTIVSTENDTDIEEPVISSDEGAACIEVINNFCAPLSQP